MKGERQYETMRSNNADFGRVFSDFVSGRHKEGWNVAGCTFFSDDQRDRKWAFCTFER